MSAAPRLYCMEGYQDCEWPPSRPDPRTPPLELGDNVLCEDCFRAAIEQMIEDHESEIEGLKLCL